MITKEYLQQELAKRIDGYKRGVETSTDNIIAEMKSILVLVDALNDYEKKYKEALVRVKKYYDMGSQPAHVDLEYIFPELRGSEDERIRRTLVEYFGRYNPKDKWDDEFSFEDVLSYLERQKEPTPADGWDYADKRMSHPLYREGFEAGQAVERELSEFEKKKEQKPAWSEEDKRRIDAICELLENTSAIHPNYSHRKLIIWLKSIPERFNIQPKQEWSEEDEKMRANAILSLQYLIEESPNADFIDSVKKEKAWLISLRPQPHWKPSEEQEEPGYYQHFDPDC